MKEKTLIELLQSNRFVPPEGAVDRCVAALPRVRRLPILPLIRLQVRSLPGGMYGASLCLTAAQLYLTTTMEALDALVISGISGALVALLLGWHLLMAVSGEMGEMERCCRYSYGQILLSRVLCLCLLTAAAVLSAAVPGAVIHGHGIRYVALSLLPTAWGALAALRCGEKLRGSDLSLMSVYLIVSIPVSLNLNRLMELPPAGLALMVLASGAVLCARTRVLLTRSVVYEAYTD